MASRTVSPPEDLPTGRGIYACLVIPFDEPASHLHDQDPGGVYTWADVRLPRRQVAVLDGHDGEQIGIASHWIKDRDALWCAIKLGRRGEEILRRGTGASAELVDGEVSHVALAGSATPGFASAGVYSSAGAVLVSDAPLRLGLDAATGLLAVRRPEPWRDPSPPVRSAVDLGEHKREMQSLSMAAVHAAAERDREAFERRKTERVEEDYEREELRLVASMVPVHLWPAHLPQRRSFDEMLSTRRAKEVAEYEARRTVQLLEFELAAAAVPPPKRRWWRWWTR